MAVTEKSGLVRRDVASSSRYGAIKENTNDHHKLSVHQPTTYFTRRDCIIVLIVVGLALAAIVVSLVFGLPALEAKRLAMANANSTESEELISNLTTTTIAPSS
ncbi:uncharacterized protein LOC100902513 isoform X2 [Galendromus occidentalis]|uniref:Uncharacterized protein LOC100902513 isoform X2 n=1 Tax=Galendromus occidentalis TaxID=34638 RepID=A0AAJ6QX30_9ACAR|nr:uncharacterized protein LOC100902513 isoform X2 [Galendromus occidentalis]